MGKLALPTSWRKGMSMGSVPLQKPIYPDNWVYKCREKYSCAGNYLHVKNVGTYL